MVGCLYFLIFCKVSETVLGGKAWNAPPETRCVLAGRHAWMGCVASESLQRQAATQCLKDHTVKCYFNYLEICYPFLIILPTDFVFLGGTRGTCLVNQWTAWEQELILRQGDNGHWFLNKLLSTQNTVWHFCSQWFYLHQVRPKVQIKCRTPGWGVGMHENPPLQWGLGAWALAQQLFGKQWVS